MGNPTFLYKMDLGELKAEIFDSDDLPEGWYDSPDKAKDNADKVDAIENPKDQVKAARTKEEVYAIMEKHDLKPDKRLSLVNLKKQAKRELNGNS